MILFDITFKKENIMFLKTISIILLALLLGTTTVVANHTKQLNSLAGHQQMLSTKIAKEYSKNHNIMKTVKALEAGQKKLKKIAVRNAEINNLFHFLTICIDEMKVLVKKPYSTKNAQKIVELGVSISEGSRYIAKA